MTGELLQSDLTYINSSYITFVTLSVNLFIVPYT